MRHKLKIQNQHFDDVQAGRKDFEVRFNDRDYKKGDELCFTDVSGLVKKKGLWRVKHIHSGLGMAEGYVILGLTRVEQ